MKKFILSSIIIASLLFNLSTFSYTLTDGEDTAIDQAVEMFQKKIIKNSEKIRDDLIATLNKISSGYVNDEKRYEILRVLTERLDEIKFEVVQIQDNSLNEKNDNTTQEETPNQSVTSSNNPTEGKTDLTKVRQAWLDWQNEVRYALGLKEYTYSSKLDKTAEEWSELLSSRGALDVNSVHKRDLTDSYYDYNKIASWMKDRGVVCKNIDRATFSESVAWTSYYCPLSESDCTARFIDSLRVSFDRYMGERDRNENSRPHYNAIVSNYFGELGVGFAIKEVKADYFEVFVTTHYCTEME